MKNQKLAGVVISYSTTILQIIINFFFTPFLIKSLGTGEYGLYQTISSFANNLTIVNFGIASIMSRNVIKYRIYKDYKGLENLLGMGVIISCIISIIILFIGSGLTIFIEPLYGNSLTSGEIIKAKYMFIYLVINLAIIAWNNMFSGISVGYEQFIFTNGLKLFRQILRVIIMTVLLLLGKDSLAIVISDVVVTIILLVCEAIFCLIKLRIKIKIHYIDKVLMINIFTFSMASLLQSITNQVNLSLDKTILGIMTTTSIVSIYSVALLILNTFISITKVIGSVYLPQATKLVIEKRDGEELTDLIIKTGRIQNIIGLGIFGGFLVLGKNFLQIWVGPEFTQVWSSVIILLFPAIFTCVTSTANIIIDAMLKKMARSLILILTSILNFIITINVVERLGYMGAALGTSISMIIGEVILLNIYYKKRININVKRMYKEIFRGILKSNLITVLLITPISIMISNTVNGFILKSLLYIFSYLYMLWKFGINKSEKRWITDRITDKINIKILNEI